MVGNLIRCTGHERPGWNAEQMERYCRLLVGWNTDGTAAEVWLSAVPAAENYCSCLLTRRNIPISLSLIGVAGLNVVHAQKQSNKWRCWLVVFNVVYIRFQCKVPVGTLQRGLMGFESPSGELCVCRERQESNIADRLQLWLAERCSHVVRGTRKVSG